MASAALLSPLAEQIIHAHPDGYRNLVVHGGAPPQALQVLGNVRPEQLLAAPVQSPGYAAAMLSGLWLWHDALEECHVIAQKTPADFPSAGDRASGGPNARLLGPTLNFWHAIMHRREGDFWNSKYWYARCRNHPALADLGARTEPVLATLADAPLAGRLGRGGWDPDAFVDWVESLHRRPDPAAVDLAIKLQRIEWEALFDFCARAAVGG